MKKSMYSTIIFIGLLFLVGTMAQAQTWMARYYKNNPMSLDRVIADYGTPLNTIEMNDGVQKMIFGPRISEIGYIYFLVKNGMVIDKNVTDNLEKKDAAKTYAGPTPKGYMADYYKKNPMTLAALKAKWGTPVRTDAYDNGITKLTFGPNQPEIGYMYFLIKDGMVVDKNCTGSN